MVKALTVGISVLTGILIGRIQVVQNHDANEAIVAAARAEKRADEAKVDALRTRILLTRTERKVVDMWRHLEPMLEDFTHASSPIDRDSARQRIQSLRWEMQALDTAITASNEVGVTTDVRTAWLK
jgi:hypothetical protein